MKSFVFKDRRSAETYFWLKRTFPGICEDLRVQIFGEEELSESGVDPSAVFQSFICEKVAEEVDQLVWGENPLRLEKGDFFADMLRRDLDALDYREIAFAVLMNVEEPQATPVPVAT
jgi:hypothetical protein